MKVFYFFQLVFFFVGMPMAFSQNPIPPTVTYQLCNGQSGWIAITSPEQGITLALINSPFTQIYNGTTYQGGVTVVGMVGTTNNLIVATATNQAGNVSTTTLTNVVGPSITNVSVSAVPAIVCPGASASLQPSITGGTYPFTFSWEAVGDDPFASTLGSPFVTPTANTTYNYRITDARGCLETGDVQVNIASFPATPILTASGPTTICEGASVTLSTAAATGVFYQWNKDGSTISGATSTSYTASTSGNYTLMAQNLNYCKSTSAAKSVTVNPAPPAPSLTVSPLSICEDGAVAVNVSTPAPYQYIYSRPANYYIIGGGGTSAGFGESVRLTTGGNFVLTAKNTSTNCTSTTTRAVTVTPGNAFPISTISPTSICAGSTMSIPFTIASCAVVNSNNVFTAQLSDVSGNFTNPVNIGTLTTTTAGTITGTIPAGTIPGTNYRIRIISNSGALGKDNGISLAITNACGGLIFDGMDDQVSVTVPTFNNNNDPFTIEAWIRVPVGSPNLPIVSNRSSSSTTGILFQPAVDENTNGKKLMLQIGTNKYYSSVFSSSIFDNTCHHIAVTRNGSSLYFYLDGVLKGSAVMSGSYASTNIVRIGHDDYSNQSFNGIIDEVRLWRSARTATELVTFKNVSVPVNAPYLDGSWDFNEPSGQQAYNVKLNGPIAYLGMSSATETQDPSRTSVASCYQAALKSGLTFDGDDDYAELPSSTAYPTTGDFTMEVVVRLADQIGLPVVLSRRGYTDDGFLFGVLYGNQFIFQLSGTNYYSAKFNSIYDNLCHHLAVVRSAGVFTFYVDGIPVAGNPYNNTSIGASRPIRVGSDFINQYSLLGDINEVRIWNVARTALQISDNKNQLLAMNTNLVGYWKFQESYGEKIFDASGKGNHGFLGNNATLFDEANPQRHNNSCYSFDKFSYESAEQSSEQDSLNEIEPVMDVYPNPFSFETTILVHGGKVQTVRVFDLNGKLVETHTDGDNHEIKIGSKLPLGVYLVEINTNEKRIMKKIIKFE